MSAEAVVLSKKMVPLPMPAKAPSGPSTTERRSSSLPTQQNTISWPVAAFARRLGGLALVLLRPASALAKVRL